MVDAATALLQAKSVPADRIYFDKFTTSVTPPPPATAGPAPP